MNKWFFAAMAAAVLVSCWEDGPESEPFVAFDVRTGVMLGGGGEIVMLDANVGAKGLGDTGRYLDWEEAVVSCPEGYHLMTKAEAEAVVREFDTIAELRDGILHMPLTGCIMPPSTSLTITDYGFYHLAEQYDEKQSWYFCFGTYESIVGVNGEKLITPRKIDMIDIYFDRSTTRHPARCVKDYPSAGPA